MLQIDKYLINVVILEFHPLNLGAYGQNMTGLQGCYVSDGTLFFCLLTIIPPAPSAYSSDMSVNKSDN